MRRLAALLAEQRQDLSFLALVQVPLLAANLLLAKLMAVRHAYPDAPAESFVPRLGRVLSQDLLFLAALWLAILLSRRLRGPARHRAALVALVYVAFALATAVHFVHAGFFMYFGAPLSVDLVALAPDMAAYAGQVITPESAALSRLLAVGVASALVLTPLAWRVMRPGLVRDERSWRGPAWAVAVALGAAGALLGAIPVAGYRERALRRLSAATLVIPARTAPRATLTTRHRDVLDAALGPERHEGAAAFQALPRRPYNVLIWVLESVGERFMRSHHPLGEAATPHLDRLAKRGSVRFSQVYAQAPVSAQTDWALMTGMNPPALPAVFKSSLPLPRHGPLLSAVFGSAGYRTAFISSSYLESWGEMRFLRKGRLDLLEDMTNLANRANYQRDRWSIDGNAVVDRFTSWLDAGGPGERPFFSVLWNVESHHPYTWVGMPRALRAAGDYTRYLGAIGRADALLGRVHEALAARGLERDTLIVVVGDHGQGLGRGDRPHDRIHSLLLTEDDLHVPLVFLHPALPAGGRTVDAPATHKDVYPTLLDLTGLAAPAEVDGVSLARPYRPGVLISRTITWWPTSARAGRYKLVQDLPAYPPELYDMAADTWETNDVSMVHAEVTEALLAYLSDTNDRVRALEEHGPLDQDTAALPVAQPGGPAPPPP